MRRVPWMLMLCLPLSVQAADWKDLMPQGKTDGWTAVGDGLWHVLADGTLAGTRPAKGAERQAWLYTREEFGDFDLQLEYWLRWGGNSGVSIRDPSRGAMSHGKQWVADKTPSHQGYEIQLASGNDGDYPSGSIYLFSKAAKGAQRDFDWNALEIRSRKKKITVLLNGRKVAEHAGDPKRPVRGPVGLQLHDPASVVMFRNIRIRAK